MSAKAKYQVETTYINEFMQIGYGVSWTWQVDCQMARGEFDLTDLNHVLKTGYVFDSDMLELDGIWSVFGRTLDEKPLEVTVSVRSTEYRVRVLFVEQGTGR